MGGANKKKNCLSSHQDVLITAFDKRFSFFE
jgi:hypothetical protein